MIYTVLKNKIKNLKIFTSLEYMVLAMSLICQNFNLLYGFCLELDFLKWVNVIFIYFRYGFGFV